jgi:Leucine-rich repeat (LRR) protein
LSQNNQLVAVPEVKPRKWKMVEKLFLRHNQLTQVPAGYFMLPKLTTLDLEFNKLQTLPPDLVTMRGSRMQRHMVSLVT